MIDIFGKQYSSCDGVSRRSLNPVEVGCPLRDDLDNSCDERSDRDGV